MGGLSLLGGNEEFGDSYIGHKICFAQFRTRRREERGVGVCSVQYLRISMHPPRGFPTQI